MNCWITTHWPSPAGMEVTRNVYFKDWRAALPGVGDVVLIYESETATVKGKAVKQAILHHRGRRETVELPKGRGRIVAAVTVKGEPRAIGDEDRVYDYGDLSDWSVIPCGDVRGVLDASRG